MIRLIVSDSSCLIDLHKVRLLPVMLRLPHRFIVPPPVRNSEMPDLTDREWRCLEDAGLVAPDPPFEQVAEALALRTEHPALSSADCACLVEARHRDNSVLLTGDRRLRRVAEAAGLCVHGVLWIVDELWRAGVCCAARLIAALERWRDDPTVFLPGREIHVRLQGLRHLVGGGGHISG